MSLGSDGDVAGLWGLNFSALRWLRVNRFIDSSLRKRFINLSTASSTILRYLHDARFEKAQALLSLLAENVIHADLWRLREFTSRRQQPLPRWNPHSFSHSHKAEETITQARNTCARRTGTLTEGYTAPEILPWNPWKSPQPIPRLLSHRDERFPSQSGVDCT